jgi:hypothetical protein
MHVFLIGRLNLAATAAVKAVVHDWSAVGLVGTSVWLDIDGDPTIRPGDRGWPRQVGRPAVLAAA